MQLYFKHNERGESGLCARPNAQAGMVYVCARVCMRAACICDNWSTTTCSECSALAPRANWSSRTGSGFDSGLAKLFWSTHSAQPNGFSLAAVNTVFCRIFTGYTTIWTAHRNYFPDSFEKHFINIVKIVVFPFSRQRLQDWQKAQETKVTKKINYLKI